jgi:hypothetical protein
LPRQTREFLIQFPCGKSGQEGEAIRFFDLDERLKRSSDPGDQFHAGAADFEIFRPELERALSCSDIAKGGRPPFDPVMMFKILVIGVQNNLSDAAPGF